MGCFPHLQYRIRYREHKKLIFCLAESIYAFQGKLSPVLYCSIVEICVVPILLYGVEDWVLLPESIRMLECFQGFQGVIAKRIFKLPKWFTNTMAIAHGWNPPPLSLHYYIES